MKAFIKLYAINFKNSKESIFFTFFFPVMLLLILGSIMPFKYIANGLLLVPTLVISLTTSSTILAEFKSSSIFKRIGTTKITKTQLILSLILFNVVLILVATLFLLAVIAIFNQLKIGSFSYAEYVDGIEVIQDMSINFSKVNFFEWLYILLAILSTTFGLLSIGLFIGTKVKSVSGANMVSLMIYFPLSFLTGVFLDISMIKSSNVMNTISLMLLPRWTFEPIVELIAEGSFTNVSHNFMIYMGPIAMVVIGVAFTILMTKTFKWD